MADRVPANEAQKVFAMLTAEFEDASTIAAGVQRVQTRARAKRALRSIRKVARRTEQLLDRLEVLLE